METNLRERLTMYRCFMIRSTFHCWPEFSFKRVVA